ncbi:MAG: hypothetical protein HDT08_03295 [Bacteroidales bacterium]|nr:hypothetical protein [Bacteroidales bacterium]
MKPIVARSTNRGLRITLPVGTSNETSRRMTTNDATQLTLHDSMAYCIPMSIIVARSPDR